MTTTTPTTTATTLMDAASPRTHGRAPTSRHANPLVLVGMELRKLKGSSFGWMALGMIALVSAWSGLAFMKRAGSDSPTLRTVGLAQGEIYQIVGLLAPILAALLTSRLTVLETGERMNLKWLSLGQSETSRFLAKLLVAGTTVSLCFLIPLAWIPLAASSRGFSSNTSFAKLIVAPMLIVLFASFAVTAIQLALSMAVRKQAVGLGVGVIAGVIGSGLGPMNMARLGWLFPAGISSAANPFLTTVGPNDTAVMTLTDNPEPRVLAGLLACGVWIVISAIIIKTKEARR